MQIHGDIDGVVSYNGLGGIVSSVHIDSLVKKWVVYNNCNATPSLTNLPNINTSDNSTVEHYVYSGGLKNTTVEFYKIIGGGHTWPGSSILVTSNGNTNLDFNASKEIWRFFSQYSLDNLVTNTKDFTTGNKVIKIFPNPSNGTFSVHSTTNNIEKVSVFSTDGKLLKSISLLNKQLAVEVSDFAKGVYFIKVECSNKQLYTSKLIVE
jgi:polyhydroxybutyrate depolymerase